MQITTYSLKGAPLTIAEMDRNFEDLRDAILAVVGGVHVTGWHQDDNDALFFEYSDGQKIGPIVLPTKTLRLRGAWRTGEVYAEHDVYVSDGTSYLVGVLHMSTTIAADVAAGHVGVLAAKGDAPADAPANGKIFGRRDGAWVVIPPGGSGGIEEAPENGRPHVRQDGAWIEMPASEGGTGGTGFMTYRGRFEGFRDYAFGDVVSLGDDSFWLCIKPVSQGGDTPSIPEPGQQSNASWRLLTWPGPEAQYAQGGSIRVRTSGSSFDSLANVVADLRKRIADLEAAR